MPFSFALNARPWKYEISWDQRNNLCIEWPRAKQIYQFDLEFSLLWKITKTTLDVSSKNALKRDQWKQSCIFRPKAVMLTSILLAIYLSTHKTRLLQHHRPLVSTTDSVDIRIWWHKKLYIKCSPKGEVGNVVLSPKKDTHFFTSLYVTHISWSS